MGARGGGEGASTHGAGNACFLLRLCECHGCTAPRTHPRLSNPSLLAVTSEWGLPRLAAPRSNQQPGLCALPAPRGGDGEGTKAAHCHPAEVTGECCTSHGTVTLGTRGLAAPRWEDSHGRTLRTHLRLPGGVLAWRGPSFLPPALQPLGASGHGAVPEGCCEYVWWGALPSCSGHCAHVSISGCTHVAIWSDCFLGLTNPP